MFEKIINTAGGWIEGLKYPSAKRELDTVKYQWYTKQSKTLYPHALKDDTAPYFVVRVTNKSLGKIGIYDFPLKEEELKGLMSFYTGNNDNTNIIGKADKLLLGAFGIRSDKEVFQLSDFKFKLSIQHLMAFRNDDPDRPFGIRSTTLSPSGIDIQYAFFTQHDMSVISEELAK